MSQPTIRPLKTQQELDALVLAAGDDGHSVAEPTHIIQKDGRIVGYFSVIQPTVVGVWTSSKDISARESTHLLSSLDDLIACSGKGYYLMPCKEDSPYFYFMGRLGFKEVLTTRLFRKDLTVNLSAETPPVKDI